MGGGGAKVWPLDRILASTYLALLLLMKLVLP
jgi:hypothetical protein